MKTCSVIIFCFLALPVVAAEVKPNIIFILADDLGWADTTLYGHTKYYQTPNLERLAKRGMTFNRAYAASPLCSPTRSSIMTGLSPARTGITTPNCHLPEVVLQATVGKSAAPNQKAIAPTPPTRLKTEYVTLPEVLRDAGYATGHFGKWHLGPEPYSPLQQGFAVDIPHFAGPGPAGSYVAPWKFKNFDADPDVPDQHIEDRMAQEAVKWLEQHRDEPFYMNYWMFSVHAPFDAKQALIEKYRGKIDPASPQRSPTYAAMVESMDDAVGTLLDTLDRLKIADRTIIVFFSDNGGNMYNEVDGTSATSNAPLRGGKATVFEGGIREPCVICVPGMTKPGSRSDTLIQSTGFLSAVQGIALLENAGNPVRRQKLCAGPERGILRPRPDLHLLSAQSASPRLAAAVGMRSRRGLETDSALLPGRERRASLAAFNLANDVGEKQNLADKESERVRRMDALIEKFLVETKAVQPIRNPAFDPAKYDPSKEGQAKPKSENPPPAKAKPSPRRRSRRRNSPIAGRLRCTNFLAAQNFGRLSCTSSNIFCQVWR